MLVGHSCGGMVITGVAAKESQRLAHLVYVDDIEDNRRRGLRC
ncbi:MAG: alpha/beta hydrolase [Thermoproteota archaeon]|nr:alpha/beta hydrolase [Thermoproteota archaeon]